MTRKIVIIAAGGKGNRAGTDLPKQYQLLSGKPVLMHTIAAFDGIADEIVVVLDPAMETLWKQLCVQHRCDTPHVLVHGGATRFASVKNGLEYIQEKHGTPKEQEDMTIAVHDGARPLVDRELIRQSFALAQEGHGNVLGIKSSNSVRIGTADASEAIDRDRVWLIQTPQTFPAKVLFQAFRQEEQPSFTDEASVVQKLGYNVRIVESNPKNIKITYPDDFAVAQSYTKN